MTINARRVVFSAIKQVEWETLSLPDELGPTQVLVKAVRTLVSAGTEIAIYSGAHIGYSTPGSRYPRLPYHAGYAFAGTVEAAGAEVTGGQGVNVAIEATGNAVVTNDALHSVARLGRVVLLGSPRGKLEIDIYHDIHGRGVSLIGAHANTMPTVPNAFHPWTLMENRRLALELMRQGRLQTDGLITHRVAAADALPVWDALTTHQQDYLGVIITWD